MRHRTESQNETLQIFRMKAISRSYLNAGNVAAWPVMGLALVFPILALVAPQMTIPAFAVAMVVAMAFGRGCFDRIGYGSIVPLALLVLWAAASLLWTPDLQDAGSKFQRFLVLFVLVVLGLSMRMREEAKGPMLVSVTLVLGLLVFESVTGNALIRSLYEVPTLTLSDIGAASRLNRGIVTLAFVVWGVSLLLRRRWVLVVLPAMLTAFFMLFESLSGVVGLGAGTLAAGAALIHRRLGRLVVAGAIVIALFGVPFMVSSGLINSERAPSPTEHSAGDSTLPDTPSSIGTSISNILWEVDSPRVKVWHLMTDRFVEKSVVGWGFRASRTMYGSLHNGHMVNIWYPHNAGLEFALELGTIGVLLIAVWLGILERRVAAFDGAGRVAATGLFVTMLGVSTSAFSIWQAQTLLSMVFGFMAWKIGMLALRTDDDPVTSAVRY